MIVIDLYYNICKCEGNKLLALFILKQEYVQGMYVCVYIHFSKKRKHLFLFFKETVLSPGSYYDFYMFILIPEPL